MHTTSDTIFYRKYPPYYVNIINIVNYDLGSLNNRLQTATFILCTKCHNFVSGLYTLAENKVPESILHTDIFTKILYTNDHQNSQLFKLFFNTNDLDINLHTREPYKSKSYNNKHLCCQTGFVILNFNIN